LDSWDGFSRAITTGRNDRFMREVPREESFHQQKIHVSRFEHRMTRRANHVLHIAISILLVFCSPPAISKCNNAHAQQLQSSPEMAHFAQAIMESGIGPVDLVQRDTGKSSDRAFHDAVVTDQTSIGSTTHLAFSPFNVIDRLPGTIGLKAISSRAPPRFII
jgi:hypothetical protein